MSLGLGVGTLTGFGPPISFTRPADTTAYTAGDVVGGLLAFPYQMPFGANFFLNSAFLRIFRTTVIASETTYKLHMFSNKPSAIADNAPFTVSAADGLFYLGQIDLPQVVDLGALIWSKVDNLQMQRKLQQLAPAQLTPEDQQGTYLHAYLVTDGAYTPESATVHHISVNGFYM